MSAITTHAAATARGPWATAPWEPRRWQREALPAIIRAIRQGDKPVVSAFMGSGKSILAAELACLAHAQEGDGPVVISAPRQNLVEQLAGTFAARFDAMGLPDHVGRYYAHAKEHDRAVVVTCNASLPSLATRIGACKLLIADEAHGTEAEHVRASIEALSPRRMCGFTATPFRSTDRETLSLWSAIAYRYTWADAIADGVVVPWRLVSWDGEGADASDLDAVCLRLIDAAKARGLRLFPALANASSIADAEEYSVRLAASADLRVEPVHSGRSRDENASTIARLRDGELDVVVHVSMLAEGADYPWLQGLLLRRSVGSRVRFVQEVGRPLRAAPGKEYATILDPFNLFGELGIEHPDSIGQVLEDALRAERQLTEEEVERQYTERLAVAVTDVETWSREVLDGMIMARLIAPDPWRSPDGDGWRQWPPSSKQLSTLRRLRWLTRFLPPHARKPARKLIDASERLPRGAVSDMISVLMGLARATEDTRQAAREHHAETGTYAGAPQWRWPRDLAVPVPPGPPPVTPDVLSSQSA